VSGESNRARRAEIERYFVDENLEGDPTERRSPSGRYRLVVRVYRTEPGAWHYSRGTVTRVADGAVVCDLKRNHGGFHHTFLHKNDRDYLIAGRSYMSQTIVDLDGGREYEPDGDHYDGSAFCWMQCLLSPDGNTLVVDGCIWACPGEYRFYDFTDPSRGWPELPIVGTDRIEDPSHLHPPRWLDATTLECFHTVTDGDDQVRTRLQRRDDQMIVVEHGSA
jgi:hypothetical protein